MRSDWPRIRLGDVLNHTPRPVTVEPNRIYREIGIRSHGRGIFHKIPVTGAEIGSKRVFRIEPGDFVLNIVFAWEGAVAVASASETGMIGSHRFPTFRPEPASLDPKYLLYLFRTAAGADLLGRVSPGGAGRNRTLNRSAFLGQEVPLPPLWAQQRIVSRIEELIAEIRKALILQKQTQDEARELCRAILATDAKAMPTPMRELVRFRSPDVAVRAEETYQFAGVYSFGRGMFRAQAKSGMAITYRRLTRLQRGNFVYPKLMAWEGAFGVVPAEFASYVVSTEFPVFEILEDRVYPEVLEIHFQTPSVWPRISRASTGTNVRRRRMNPKDFLNYRLPLPSGTVQQRLRLVKARVDRLSDLQQQAIAELDALIPVILDRAFKGEL